VTAGSASVRRRWRARPCAGARGHGRAGSTSPGAPHRAASCRSLAVRPCTTTACSSRRPRSARRACWRRAARHRLARRQRRRGRARRRPPRLGHLGVGRHRQRRALRRRPRAGLPRRRRRQLLRRRSRRAARSAGRTRARARSSAPPRSARTWSTSAAPPIASSRSTRTPASGGGSTSATCPRASRFTATPGRACAAGSCWRVRRRYFVSLAASSGEVTWAKSLAAASDQFVDVDSTPALERRHDVRRVVLGRPLRARRARRTRRWRLGIEGVGDVTAEGGPLYFVGPALRLARRAPRRPRAVAPGPERGGRL
jgi:hypothetical protein